MKISHVISDLIDVPTADPDDARRRRLLNILLTGVALIASLGLVAIGTISLAGMIEGGDSARLLSGLSIALFGFIILFLINRYISGQLAGALFVTFLTLVIGFSDAPEQVVAGRSTFLFTIPILMASVILRPWASFVMAGTVSALTASLDVFVLRSAPGIPNMLGFFAVAFVAWLSARSLETALADLRAINEELDQRVEDRTRELREANIQLAEANERLKEVDRLKSRFVAMVSHELRTPLNAIQGFTEMLQAGIYGSLSLKQQEALGRVSVNTGRLLQIVNDLLDQARIEAGQLSLTVVAFSPIELAEDVKSTMAVLAEARDLSLTTQVESAVPNPLYGDRQRLHQILVNLTNNALKFTSEGGVDIRMYRPDADHWGVQVSDTGIGIPEEAREYIFDPFRQVDGSATREHRGTGMGLSIVKQLVQLMGGTISVDSAVGAGSTFTVILPIVNVPEEEIA